MEVLFSIISLNACPHLCVNVCLFNRYLPNNFDVISVCLAVAKLQAPRLSIVDMDSQKISSNQVLKVEKSVGAHGGAYACFSREHSKPIFIWEGPEVTLPEGVSQSAEKSSMVLEWKRSLQLNDSGIYRCIHRTEQGISVATLYIRVLGKLEIVTFFC